MENNNEILDGLNGLLHRGRDAQKGYIEAANHITSPELSQWMIDYSNQRKAFSRQLELEIRKLGGEPDDGTSALGELHRVWIDLKGQLTNEDSAAVLEECLRGEQHAIEDYDALLENGTTLPASTLQLLTAHKARIVTAADQIKKIMAVLEGVR